MYAVGSRMGWKGLFRLCLLVVLSLPVEHSMAGMPALFDFDVILAGGPVPELGAGVIVNPSGATINESGDLLIDASLSGAGITTENDATLWRHTDAGGAVMFARSGRPAAGFDFLTTYAGFYNALLDDDGGVLLTAEIAGPSIDTLNGSALWSGDPLAFGLHAQQGDQVPGLPASVTYPRFDTSTAYSAGGHMATLFTYSSPGIPESFERVLLFGTPDNLAPYATTDGQVAPGGVVLDQLQRFQVNRHGQLAIQGNLAGGANAIFTDASGVFRAVVIAGQQAPGMAAGVTIEQLNGMTLHDGGRIGFLAEFDGPGINSGNIRAYWLADPDGQLTLLAREGDLLPYRNGTASMRVLQEFYTNNDGTVAIAARIDLPPVDQDRNTGVWYGSPGEMELVIQRRDPIPSVTGFEFGEMFNPVVNDRDLLVFSAHLIREGNSTGNVDAVFAFRDGVLIPLVIAGDVVDVSAPGEASDLRTVSTVLSSSAGPDTGFGHSLNDQDQLALTLSFSNGTNALLRYDLTGVFAPGIAGDLTGDGFVGVEDLDVLLANWGRTTYAGSWRDGDADGDGIVGTGDLQTLLDHWSEGTPPGGVVPEPGTVVFLAGLALGVGRRRKYGRCAPGAIKLE